jgi:hypothetical protein
VDSENNWSDLKLQRCEWFKNNKGLINERKVTVSKLSTLSKNICYGHFFAIVRIGN